MNLLESDDLLKLTKNIIHKDTQQHALSIDLTVAEILHFNKPGSLDFGGSEFRPAHADRLKPKKKNEDDDYGWWNLEAGTYRARFNEQVGGREDTLLLLSPHSYILQAGIIASTSLLSSYGDTDDLTMCFNVPHVGCNIKENARFATLFILEH